MRERGSLAIGDLLCGKWQILRILGAGGMATVYDASHRNGKRVAIKILHPELRTNEQARTRFLREGYIANRVGHLDVPSVLDDGETADGDAFLVMDLLVGETLELRSKTRPLSPQEVTQIALAVLDVLAAAHERGIVHRDLKPSNVFLTTDGSVKVLDFGIARMREALPEQDPVTLSRGGGALGTPSFMAPEQARGHWDEIDARTDIWGLGALLFALLTGRNVHEGQTTNELMILSATAPAPPIASIRPDLAADLARVVDRALSFHRELRWPDARAMHRAVESLRRESNLDQPLAGTESSLSLASAAVSTTSDQLSAVVEVPRRSRRSGLLSLAAAVLLATGAAVWLVNSKSASSVPTASGQPSRHELQPAVAAPGTRTEPATLLSVASNPIVQAPPVVEASRNSRAGMVPPRAAAIAERRATEPLTTRPRVTEHVATAPLAPPAAPPAPAADDWLERQK